MCKISSLPLPLPPPLSLPPPDEENMMSPLKATPGTTMVSPSKNALPAIIVRMWPLVALVIVWWGASAWNMIAAKQVVLLDPSAVPLMALISNVPGALGWCALWVRDRTLLKHTMSRSMIPLAIMHSIGLYASYMGLVGAKVSLVQVVKSTEPLIAMALSVFLLGQMFSLSSVLAASAVVFGVSLVCVTDTSYSWTALAWVLVSCFSTQMRNQLMKRTQKELQEEASSESSKKVFSSPINTGIIMFVITSAYAVLVTGAMMLVSIPLSDQLPKNPLLIEGLLTHLLLAGGMHFSYNLASFGVLSLTSPASHSLANTTKRALVIGLSAIFLKESWNLATTTGITITLFGSMCYAKLKMSETKNPQQTASVPSVWCKGSSLMRPPTGREGILLFVLVLVACEDFWNDFGDMNGIASSMRRATIVAKSGGGCEQTCLYQQVSLCLETNERFEHGDFSFAELDARVDSCVQAWSEGKCYESDESESESPFLVNFLGRGELKDRVDWSVYRQGLTETALANMEYVCKPYFHSHQNVESIIQPPIWWDASTSLPSVSLNSKTAGSFLPPWYEGQDLPNGYALPQGPIRGETAASLAAGEFRPNVYAKTPNLGDCYNHYLLRLTSGKSTTGRSKGPILCAVGSILSGTCDVVWGSGIMMAETKVRKFRNQNSTEIFAVRGPHTYERLSKDVVSRHRTVFGDPGLLAPLIYPMPSEGEEDAADVCVIPHYIDHELPIIKNLLNRKPDERMKIRLLNIETCSLDEYFQDMRGCKTILSSSLHGIIFGIAHGVPSMRILLSSKVAGGHFKFEDFFGGIGHPELYVYEDLTKADEIPFADLLKDLSNMAMPALNMEDLWNSNPLHAESLGTTREDHLGFAENFVQNLHDVYPHQPYVKFPEHLAQTVTE